MTMELDYATRLYKCRKTCFTMLADRGYIVAASDKEQTLEEFKDK